MAMKTVPVWNYGHIFPSLLLYLFFCTINYVSKHPGVELYCTVGTLNAGLYSNFSGRGSGLNFLSTCMYMYASPT